MKEIRFPLWLVFQRRENISWPVTLDDHVTLVAFTKAAKGTAFMVGRGESSWEFQLITRVGFVRLMAELRKSGIKAVCLDPTAKDGGRMLALDEVELE